MGGKRLGGIQSRTVPDIKLFTKQKKSIIVIKSERNDCLLKAIAIGIKVNERSSQSTNRGKTRMKLHLDRASVQMREMQHLITLLKSDPTICQDILQSILGSNDSSGRRSLFPHGNSSDDSLPYDQTVASGEPLVLQDLEFLSQSQILKDFCLSVYDSNFMGAFLKCYNQEALQNIDFLYDAQNRHVDVVILR